MTGLLGSSVLEVAIGIAFIYLLLAIFCTTANEWITAVLKTRGALLRQGILQLLAPDSKTLQEAAANPIVKQFYEHPLIKSVMPSNGPDSHPSYLPARTFAKALMDIATPNHPGSISFQDLENGIKQDLPDGNVKTALLASLQSSDKTIEDGQKAIEAWYDDAMDRVTGWYKRKTQVWTIVIAVFVTLGMNADTIHIARRLWVEPAIRSQLVEGAKTAPNPSTAAPDPNKPDTANPPVQAFQNAESTIGRVVGWTSADFNVSPLAWVQRLLGWVLTIIAVCLGAPFWFDTLNKFMNLRNAGKSPAEKGKDPAKPKMPPVNA